MSEILQNTGVKLWDNKDDYNIWWLDIFDSITGSSGKSNMRLIDEAIGNINTSLDGYYFLYENNRLYICKDSETDTTKIPVSLVNSNGKIASSVDGTTITIDENGILHGTTIDDAFSSTSTNSVQNKVIKEKFDEIETTVGQNTQNISTNTSNISKNTQDITTNTANIASNLEKINANETAISSNTSAIDILNGEGEGSVKKTAEDAAISEVTKIIANAPEDLDTLKEISDWISSHENDASAMNSAIQTNKSDITNLEINKVDKETGKGLSTNDYTTEDKNKLGGLNKTLLDKLGESTEGNLTFNGNEINAAQMTGATSDSDGMSGTVPTPTKGQENLFLRGDGTWAETSSAAGCGSVIKGITAEETLKLKKVYAKKGDTVLAEATINIGGQFTLSGITEIGDVTVTASDSTDTAEWTIAIKAYSLYEVELSFYTLYGFRISDSESNPDDKVQYISGCANSEFTPAKMNYETGEFEYGSWVGKHQWFFPKPCMLKYDGTVAYYLNPDDYTKKEDGTPSDIADANFGGNAMMEWGQHKKKIWIKIAPNQENVFEGDVYICDKQLDENFHAWSFYNNQDVLCDHFYTAIYDGSEISGKLRSLSGKTPLANKNRTQEITLATANNQSSDVLWYTGTYSDRFTINMLLILMAKTTDTKTAYGSGNNNSYTSSNTGVKATGTMNDKGMFWGETSNKFGVKVFGMEHWWGNIFKGTAGHVNDKGTQKIKMTYGKADGTSIVGYNTTGSGYHTIADSAPTGTSGGYVNKMIFHSIFGMIVKTASGSATTHYTDGFWFKNSQFNYLLVGGSSINGLLVGALCSTLNHAVSSAYWNFGASLSCKPLAA